MIAKVAQPLPMLALAAATALVKRDAARPLAIAVPATLAVSKLLKHLFPRSRPGWHRKNQHQSFPSSHASMATAYLATLAPATRAWWLAVPAAAIVAALDRERVTTRAHHVSDVLAGNAIGLAAAVLAWMIVRGVPSRR